MPCPTALIGGLSAHQKCLDCGSNLIPDPKEPTRSREAQPQPAGR